MQNQQLKLVEQEMELSSKEQQFKKNLIELRQMERKLNAKEEAHEASVNELNGKREQLEDERNKLTLEREQLDTAIRNLDEQVEISRTRTKELQEEFDRKSIEFNALQTQIETLKHGSDRDLQKTANRWRPSWLRVTTIGPN
ncbi:MAG: hypothetical protein LR015_13420 [Verrucomicrobia bacterium]|nr:hypothetical protein [Verrucomicrobiota bacterium]